MPRNARVVVAGGTLEAEAGRSRIVEDVQVLQERGVGDALRAVMARPEVDVDREVVLPLKRHTRRTTPA
jgi:hypothetical protein